jgi:chlorophyll synthase
VARAGGWRFAVDVVALARPWFWPVSLLPYYVGLLLATHRLLPDPTDPRLFIGAFVAGPLVWLAVLAVNDAFDLPGDLLNPRKAATPLTSGRMTPTTAYRIAIATAGAALIGAALVGAAFTAGTVLALALGWAYSVPPVRLKERPGVDVAANAIAVGAMGPFAGWTAVHSPHGFPWLMALQGVLVGVALYLPTTLVDYPADLAGGYRTVAVRLGPRRTYLLGLAAWVAAAALSAGLALADEVIPRSMLPLELVMVPTLLIGYHWLLNREQSFVRIAAVSFLFLLPSAAFALSYTGTI